MLKLTVGFTNINPRIDPLVDGTVKPQNIDLDFVLIPPSELFYRNLKFDEFDLFEMSISEFLIAKERGTAGKWDWSALPIFLSKAFLWLDMYVNTAAGIKSLTDLKNKRLCAPDYSMTAALWLRILLKELYGMRPGDITWYNGRINDFSHGVLLGVDKDRPAGVSLTWLTDQQNPGAMLEAGELDAAFGFLPDAEIGDLSATERYGTTRLVDNPKLGKLFADRGQHVVLEYFRKTGVIPTNHTVVVKNRVLQDNRWAALELYKAFKQSKEVAYQRARRSRSTDLLFGGKDHKEQAETFGADPYLQGIKANGRMLEILFQGSHENGLTKKPWRIEDVFYPTTLDT